MWSERKDFKQAIALERQALAMYERLANPQGCATSHKNLSFHLYMVEQDDKADRHLLAELVYDLVIENWQPIESSLELIADFIEEEAKDGMTYNLPRLVDVLNHPEFNALSLFLQEKNINPDEIQTKIDELVKLSV